MCGIAGIINYNATEDMHETLKSMIGLMQHRGPDASGIFSYGPAGLAHARLSIIDLNSGDQPIHNEDRTVWIVFNGEIFNYPELRKELISHGHRFYTQSDTEVLVHLYEEEGADFFHKLNGQFALAIWDIKKEILLLGRDRLGIRPLFYYQNGGRLVFGSEIKALFADNSIPRELDPQTLSDIFTCWSPLGSTTPFKGIYQLLPGHYIQFSRNGIATTRYWNLSYSELIDSKRPLAEWTEELYDLLYDAVRIRLRADVPVGAYLSGGLDSTFTSSLIKNEFNNLLNTFSISFTDDRFDESSYQQIAAQSIKTEHRVINCSEKDIGESFPSVIWHTEAPILRTSPSPLYLLSRLVKSSNFKVVLTGEGADEVFAGYNIFKEDKVRRFWARLPESKLRPRLLERLYPYIFTQGTKAQAFLYGFFKKGMEEINAPGYSHMLRWKNTSNIKTFFSKDILETVGDLNCFIERFEATLPSKFMSWDALSRAQYIESTIFLPNYLLSSQGDRMAMANSVEGRYPFLDHRVVEFASKMPSRYRMNGLTEKFILKQIARGLIPDELVERPKQPYRAPISKSFVGSHVVDYAEELLSEKAIKNNGYFNFQKVKRLLTKCRNKSGDLLSERENMSLVGILSTQLLDNLFIKNFPFQSVRDPVRLKIFTY